MLNNTINPGQSAASELSASTRFVRTQGAADALGFAQFMQAFENSSGYSIAESITESQERDQSPEATSDESTQLEERIDEGDDQETGIVKSPQESEPSTDSSSADDQVRGSDTQEQQRDNQRIDPANTTDDSTMTTDEADSGGEVLHSLSDESVRPVETDATKVQAPAEGTQAKEATFRLLENQSEQAKLSIKGVARALTHAADADLASIALGTRLGQTQSAQVSSQTLPPNESTGSEPRSSSSSQVAPSNSNAGPDDDLGSRSPTNNSASSPANNPLGAEASILRPNPQRFETAPQAPVDAKSDQSTADVQQVRSQRVDAGAGVSQLAQPVRTTTELISSQNAGQLAGVGRMQSLQAARAVTGTESGNVGQQQAESNAGSLVEKMKATELPSESRRAGVLAQVQRGLASLLRSGNGEMTLKLTPGHLGEVRIRIRSSGDQLGVRFEVSTKEAAELLHSSAKELGVSLRAKGIQIDQIQIEQGPASETASGEARTGFDDMSNNQQGEHGNPPQSNHRGGSHEDSLQDESSQPVQPESIWTDIGLDAIA